VTRGQKGAHMGNPGPLVAAWNILSHPNKE